MDLSYFMKPKRLIFFLILFLLSAGISYYFSTSYPSKKNLLVNGKKYTPSFKLKTGTELLMVFITSPMCGYCNSKELPQLIESSKLLSQDFAKSENYNFATIGIAISWRPQTGFNHLKKFGDFDESLAGRNWLNTGAMKYVHIDVPSKTKGAVPEIVLVKRTVHFEEKPIKNLYEITKQSQLARYSGIDEIKNFVNDGFKKL